MEQLDKAFETLQTFDWGVDPRELRAIDDAVIAAHGDDEARGALETRLAAVLGGEAPLPAKQYACRHLMRIGTSASVPAVAELLADKELSHMGRFALERYEGPEADEALRAALEKAEGGVKIGLIASLGNRRDPDNVAALAGLVSDGDAATARAAALALGEIRSAEAAKALADAEPPEGAESAVTDASLACAEALLAADKKADALAIYRRYAGEGQPQHVRLAATRGMLAAAAQ